MNRIFVLMRRLELKINIIKIAGKIDLLDNCVFKLEDKIFSILKIRDSLEI